MRDLLLSRRNLDVEVIVEGDGLALAQALAQQEDARLTTHRRMGLAAVSGPEGFTLRIATARAASATCPVVLPTVGQGALQHDLTRRDFTINTLAIQLHTPHFGELLDFYGGQRDLKQNRRLRKVVNASQNSAIFRDFPLRRNKSCGNDLRILQC